jgi:hypothetical protein
MRCVRISGLYACWAAISLAFCGHVNDHEGIKRKTMPELSYAYVDFDSATHDIDESIARIMELYAMDPQVFGDPIGIITTFSDSLDLSPAGRQTALTLTDASWEPPLGINGATVPAGEALVYDCCRPYDSLDACWQKVADFARRRDYICIPPGIEIYKGFGTESAADSPSTRLIIRIR